MTLDLAESYRKLESLSSAAAEALAGQLPKLEQRLTTEQLAAFVRSGLNLDGQGPANEDPEQKLERLEKRLLSYFRLESATARDRLAELQTWLTLDEVRPVLELFAEAMAGSPIEIAAQRDEASEPLPRGRGSDGERIYLPPVARRFDSRLENFVVYKAAVLHGVTYFQLDTLSFQYDHYLEGPRAVHGTGPGDSSRPGWAAYFGSFEQPELARWLVGLLEATRIDGFLLRRWRGFRPDLTFLLSDARSGLLAQAIPIGSPETTSPLQQLRIATLDALLDDQAEGSRDTSFSRYQQALTDLVRTSASVYDSARLAAELYEHMIDLGLTDAEILRADANAGSSVGQETSAKQDGARLPSTEPGNSDQSSPSAPIGSDLEGDHRAEMDPEWLQKRLELDQMARDLIAGDADAAVGSEAQGWQMSADKLGRAGLFSLQDGTLFGLSALDNPEVDPSAPSELLAGNDGASEEPGSVAAPSQKGEQSPDAVEAARQRSEELKRRARELAAELETRRFERPATDDSFYYDEWDYEIDDYRRSWCRLTETRLADQPRPSDPKASRLRPADEFVTETRKRHADLLKSVRRQFERMRPEVLRRVRRLVDGEELDLDRLIEVVTDRKAGLPPGDDFYVRRSKQERDVAAVFLVDLSASTDTEIPDQEQESAADHFEKLEQEPAPPDDSDPWESLWTYPQLPLERQRGRRVVDIEKEAVVLMADALETLGDRYAVYGFSGYGRDKVDFFVAKEFEEPWNRSTQARLGNMEPIQSTRMGPAIRHAMKKLTDTDARVKVLLILSDGYPQDHDYGSVRGDRTYGIRDTMMALREAGLAGVHSFCITVDPAGHDYLREMCPDRSYLVIDDIESLPRELPKVYRGLTS